MVTVMVEYFGALDAIQMQDFNRFSADWGFTDGPPAAISLSHESNVVQWLVDGRIK